MNLSEETTFECRTRPKTMCPFAVAKCVNVGKGISGQQRRSRGWCAITTGALSALSQLTRNHLTSSSLVLIIVLLLNSAQGLSTGNQDAGFALEKMELESSNKTMLSGGVRIERALLQGSSKYQSLFVGPPPPTPRFINFTDLALRRRHGLHTSISVSPATDPSRNTVSIQRKYIILRKEKKSTDRQLALLVTPTATMSSASSSTLKMTIDWSQRQKSTSTTTTRNTSEPSTVRKPKKILTKVKLVEKGKQFVLWDRSTTPATSTTQSSTRTTLSSTVTKDMVTTTEPNTTPTVTTTQIPSTVNETLLYGHSESIITTTSPPSVRKREDREHNAQEPYRTITTEASSINDTSDQTVTVNWIPGEFDSDTSPVEYVTVAFDTTIGPFEKPEMSTIAPMSTSVFRPPLPPQDAFPPFQPPPPMGLEPELRRCEFKLKEICPKMNEIEQKEVECFGAGIINCDPRVATMCRLFEWDTFVREHLQESVPMESLSSTTSTIEPNNVQSPQLFAFNPPTRPLRYFFCKQPLLTKHCLGIAECVPRDLAKVQSLRYETELTEKPLLRSEAMPTTDPLELTPLAASHHATQTTLTTSTSIPTSTSPTIANESSSSSNVSKKRQEPRLSQVQVGLIGALIAVGSLMFILVTVLGYFSYRGAHQSYRIKQLVEREGKRKQSQSATMPSSKPAQSPDRRHWNKLKISPATVGSERKTPHVVTRI